MLPPDDELVRGIKDDDEEAFKILYDRYSGKILRYLYRYIGDYQKAEDLTSLTFTNVVENIHSYKELGVFSAWLYKIALNCAHREMRNTARKREISLDKNINNGADGEGENPVSIGDLIEDSRNRPDNIAEEKERKEFIYRALSQLDTKYKDVLLFCDAEGMTYREAAKILNTNKINIGIRLMRARRMLYDLLKQFIKDL